ncbi:hypothetical protein RE428_42090 [Marinobacter nanhaiticus D15-8W]|uniref:TIGR03067 domain-containing protein n=1 Tax=Marinobacter nanhaiticus D15-8W TaxID=626887 RepID=N6WWH2_9GAMM|nr:hypothetical protein [Marinobacter nanhaiticus]ENO15951.1 hypothetical protein J057_11381 [Marinobacter nanhaiticus D15-8W]BES73191.1 hypothetical protein RE428_42090 [Marinobacter nanhaiticus D15-8W]
MAKKTLLPLLLATALASTVHAAGPTADQLQGKWRIIDDYGLSEEMGDLGEDLWVFEESQVTVVSGGHAFSPDRFRLDNDVLYMGDFGVKILEFSPSRMKVDTSGIVQNLEKVQ